MEEEAALVIAEHAVASGISSKPKKKKPSGGSSKKKKKDADSSLEGKHLLFQSTLSMKHLKSDHSCGKPKEAIV